MIKNIPIEKNNPETVFESYHNASHIPGSAFEPIQAQYYNCPHVGGLTMLCSQNRQGSTFLWCNVVHCRVH